MMAHEQSKHVGGREATSRRTTRVWKNCVGQC